MTTRQLAKQYINEQIKIIRKHGGTPRLDAERLREAIAATERTFEAMRERRNERTFQTEAAGSRTLHT